MSCLLSVKYIADLPDRRELTFELLPPSGKSAIYLTDRIQDKLAQFWRKDIYDKLGFNSYSDFRENVMSLNA